MTTFDERDFRERIITAVQAALDRHAEHVLAESTQMREDAAAERARIESSMAARVDELAARLAESERRREAAEQALRDHVEAATRSLRDEVTSTLQSRLDVTDHLIGESEARATRRLEQVVGDLDGIVEGVATPMMESLRDEQSAIALRVDGLAADLRAFDEQAARMVRFFDEMSASIDARNQELLTKVEDETTRRISGLDQRVEDAMALSLRQHVETTQRVKERTERIEERLAERAFAFEEKLSAESGQRIAAMDAHIGRVSAGLDETVEFLSTRWSGIESKVAGFEEKIEQVRSEMRAVDTDALDELKEKVSSAVGEATLVRIDMDRLQARLTEQVDEVTVRLAALQSEVQDATMDVNTAVQLERLEELERAVMELDPQNFVRKDEAGS